MTIEYIKDFTEPSRSTLFLNNISVVDHAYIDDQGRVCGGSFNPNFIVSGTPDPTEKVVVDFSTIKKDIKHSIDKHIENVYANGFDHKLWVIEGFSTVTKMVLDGDVVYMETPVMKLTLPRNAVKLITKLRGLTPSHKLDYIATAFASHVYHDLEATYPNIQIEVQCINTVDEHITHPYPTFPFHYVHGLKDSTSYGCQNIAHGHRSFIQIDSDYHVAQTLLGKIAYDLDNTVFVREENVAAHTIGDNWITIEYVTGRGEFVMSLDTDAHKVVVLPTETTVEFLASYIKLKYGHELSMIADPSGLERVTQIFVSEGLSKGAVEWL